jgi:hypothetical protein
LNACVSYFHVSTLLHACTRCSHSHFVFTNTHGFILARDAHNHRCVDKHPRHCSTLFYHVLLCVLLCVHTRLLCLKTPAAPGTLREGSQSTCGSRVNGNRLRTPSRYVCILVCARPSRYPHISAPQLFTHTAIACLQPHSVNTNSLDRTHTTHPPTNLPHRALISLTLLSSASDLTKQQ